VNDPERERFDRLLAGVIEDLPPGVRRLLDEVPLIALDRPTPEMLKDLGIDPSNEEDVRSLCGLHSGVSNIERSVERSAELPSAIHIFREGILDLAGGWDQDDAEEWIEEEIWVTVLHEIGHQFGLDEDDLEELGYD